MTKRLVLDDGALDELESAIRYYEKERIGLVTNSPTPLRRSSARLRQVKQTPSRAWDLERPGNTPRSRRSLPVCRDLQRRA